MRAGRLDDAARAWDRVLAAQPNHPQALLHLGQHALLHRDVMRARALLERAALAAPKEPVVQLNIAFTCRTTGDVAGETAALDRALVLDPYYFPALLAKGAMFERLGDKRVAARVFKDALTIAPPDAQLPPEVQAQMKRARACVRSNAEELDTFLQARLGDIRVRSSGENLSRFDECKDVLLGRKKVYANQPTLLHYPHLPAIQFYDNAGFAWLKDVEAASDIICEELLSLLAHDDKDFEPYVRHREGAPINQWVELNHSPRWSAYFLWQNGKRLDDHCARCPKTAAVIQTAPLVSIPGIAPAVFFSTLDKHTRIPPHTGVTNTRAIVHLPLIVPENCGFRVGNDAREWVPGKAWIFDDTIEHEAWNQSDRLRVILIFDIWNPHLSEAERDLVSGLLTAMGEYYGDEYAAF